MTLRRRSVTRVVEDTPWDTSSAADLSSSVVALALEAQSQPSGPLDRNLRTIAGVLPIVVFGLDRSARFTWCYGGGLHATGFADDELVGQPVDVLGAPAAAAVDAVFTAGEARTLHADGLNDGTPWSVTMVMAPMPDGAGLAGVAVDTTHAEEASRHAQMTEALFAGAVQAIDEGVIIQSDTGAVVRANTRASTILGLEPGDLGPLLADRPGWRAIHEDGSPFLAEEFPGRRSLHEGAPVKGITMGCVDPDGTTTWLLVNSFPLEIDGQHGPQRVVVSTFSDITSQRSITEALHANEQRFRNLSTSAPIGIFLTDEAQRITYANPELMRQTGLTLEQIQQRGWAEIIHPDDTKDVAAGLRDFFDLRVPYVMEHRLVRPDGSVRWVRARLAHMTDQNGGAVGLVGTAADITDLVEADQRLRESEERTRAILETAAEGIVTTDEDRVIIEFNAAAERILGYDSEEVVGRLRFDDLLDPPLRPVLVSMFEDYLRHGRPELIGQAPSEVQYRHKDGHIIPVELAVTEVLTSEGRLFTGVIHDISERKAFERQLEHQATHDSLTGLPNEALLVAELEAALNRAARSHRGVGVLFVGLGRMKVVTESLGHAAGDQVVVEAARRLLTALAGSGTATVTRFSGPNLVLFAEDLDDVGDAVELATRVMNLLDRPYLIGAEEAFIATSVGIAFAPEGAGAASSLISNADVAMNRARSGGGAGIEIFDPDMRRWVDQRRKLDVAMRHGLERGEFELYYQPVMAIGTGAIHGFEALVRWNHPELGVLPPIEFIPLAEDSGLIVPLGEAILRDACSQLARWQAQYPTSGLKVSVNLSGRQLAQPDLAATVARVLHETGAHAGGLDLEITETVLLDDVDAATQTLDDLKAIGVNLAVDDFGTGYSSLTYLCRFPIDVVKVDKSFVSQLGTPSRDASIVSVVVGLAQTLQMEVVAEGVETEEQLRLLGDLDCSYAQGYLFSRPRRRADADELLRAANPEAGRRG